MNLRYLFVALFTILALVAAACGGGGGEAPVPTPTEAPGTSTPLPPTSTPAPTPTPVPTTVPFPSPTPMPEPEQSLLSIQLLEGKAEVSSSGGSSWSEVTDGMILLAGDQVRTLAVSEAVVHFGDGSKVKLDPNTALVVETFELIDGGPPKVSASLEFG